MDSDILLISSNPSQAQIFRRMGLPFSIVSIQPQRISSPQEAMDQAIFHGQKKHSIVISPFSYLHFKKDYFVVPPCSLEEAKGRLLQLQDQEHILTTALYMKIFQEEIQLWISTTVHLSALSDEEIETVMGRTDPFLFLNSLGGYHPDSTSFWIVSLEGSWDNVRGLPLQPVYAHLKNFMGVFHG